MNKLRGTFNLPVLMIIALTVGGLCFMRANANNTKPQETAEGVPHAKPALATSPASAALPSVQEEDNKGLWLTIRAAGFEVKEMTIPAGDYFVVIQNSSGIDKFSLRVERDAGERLYDVQLPRFRRTWKHMVRLAPGSYVISEPDHANWTCHITVN